MMWNSVHVRRFLPFCRPFPITTVWVNMVQTEILLGTMPMIPHMVCVSWIAFYQWPYSIHLISAHYTSCPDPPAVLECWHSVHCILILGEWNEWKAKWVHSHPFGEMGLDRLSLTGTAHFISYMCTYSHDGLMLSFVSLFLVNRTNGISNTHLHIWLEMGICA